MKQKVVILGASPKPERYSYKAMKALENNGHEYFLVSPIYDDIEGQKVFKDLSEIDFEIDTITLYVNDKVSTKLQDKILALKPKRVIFNPGSENAELAKGVADLGAEALEACTLVMLSTDQFSLD